VGPQSNPVCSRTHLASALTAPKRASSTRFAPLATTRSGASPTRNTSDLQICATSQPTAAAASSAVRVPSGNADLGVDARLPQDGPDAVERAHAAAVGTRRAISWSVRG
jgi:hypothetical protein